MTDPDLRDPRLDEAYRRIPGEEPPPALDQRIRAAARRAVGAGPESLATRRQRSWGARWRVPLSLAATVVLAVTVTLMVQDEERRAFDEAPVRAPVPAAPTAVEPQPPATAPREPARRDAQPSRPAQPAASGRAAPAPAASPPAPAADAVAPAAPKVEQLEMRRQRLEEAEPAGASAPAKPAPAPAPKPLAAQPAAAPPAPAPSQAAPSLTRERAVGDRPARELRSAPEAARSPEQWIEDIRRLKAQGRDADAAAELAEFRRRHPDYPLPVDLAR